MTENGKAPEEQKEVGAEAPKKTSANQVWVDAITKELRLILEPPITNTNHSLLCSAQQIQKRADKVYQLVCDYSNLRLRVLVDEIISMLDAVRREHAQTDFDFKATHWLRFKKKRQLYVHACGLLTQEHAYQTALLILVNTLPPLKEEPTKEVVTTENVKLELNKN